MPNSPPALLSVAAEKRLKCAKSLHRLHMDCHAAPVRQVRARYSARASAYNKRSNVIS